ncbi:hypothetical protein NC651_003674 [Populus alba x Populus x berolinensis]|nr:hypothetical protein NC651_003674 [Populus alba x Populus x berolinensis]
MSRELEGCKRGTCWNIAKLKKKHVQMGSKCLKADYEKMEAEWKLDLLRKEYALDEKRASAMRAYIPVARSPLKQLRH